MWALPGTSIISAMTRPAATSRMMLLEHRRGGSATEASVPVRRYRLARLRFDGAPADPEKRFEYLKRCYD